MIGPLVNRELLRESRHKLHFVARTLFVLLLGLLIIQILTRLPSVGRYGPPRFTYVGSVPMPYLSQADLAPYGARVFAMWALVQYIALCVISTVRAAQLADERRTGALPLVRATCLQDRGLIRGWYYSVMGRALFLMLLGVPLLVMTLGFGGFTVTQLVLVVLVTILAVANGAALTLAIAARSTGAGEALIASFVLQSLSFLAFSLTVHSSWLHSFSLLYAVFGNKLASVGVVSALVVFFGTKVVMVGMFLRIARRGLAHEPHRLGAPIKRLLTALDGYLMRRTSKFGVLWKSGLGPCKGNPILWRERAVSVLGQRDHCIRLTYFPMALVLTVGLIAAFFGSIEWATGVVLVGLFAIPLLFAFTFLAVSPATFVREHQQKTVALLASTPLTARQIVLGKYFFCLGRLFVALVLCGVFLGMALYFMSWNWESLFPVLAAVALLPPVSAQIIYMSAGADSLTKAIPAALAILVIGFLGLTHYRFSLSLIYLGTGVFDDFGSRGYAQMVVVTCPLLLCLFMLVPRVRWLANAIPVILIMVFAFVLTLSLPWSRHRAETNGSLILLWPLSVAVLLLLAMLRWRRKGPKPTRWDWIAWVLFGVVFGWTSLLGWEDGYPEGVSTLANLFLSGLLFATLVRAASHAASSVFHRTVLAILVPSFALSALRALLGWTLADTSFLSQDGDAMDFSSGMVFIVTAIILTPVFLKLTIRQMDGFLGRADHAVAPELVARPAT